MDVEITVTHWPGLVINRGITFISRVATPVIYKGPITPFITHKHPPCKSRIGNAVFFVPPKCLSHSYSLAKQFFNGGLLKGHNGG